MTAPIPLSVAASVRRHAAHRRDHPLAYAELWHNEGWDTSGPEPRARTSQRVAVRNIAGSVSLAVFGGNGLGKSEAEGQLGVACMLGRDHPDTRAWLTRNGLPDDLVPPYPGRVLISALTWDDSRRIIRNKVKKYLPRDGSCVWRNENANDVAEVSAPSLRHPADPTGATIVFKSNEQGWEKYQGDEFDVILNDEEHDYDVFSQELARTNRRNIPGIPPWRKCWIAHFATLEKGRTWLWEFHAERAVEGYRHEWLHAPDCKYFDLAAKMRQYAALSANERATRLFGTPAAAVGRVYPMFSRRAHVIPPIDIPADWPRFRAIDFGTRNPFCCLWFAVDPSDTILHVYRCHYQAGLSTDENGAIVAKRSRGESYLFTAADPESLDGRRTLAINHGIDSVPANKAIIEGIADVIEYLNPDADGKVHLVFHDIPEMKPVLKEIEGYRYPDPTGKTDGKEAPLKRDDHAMDGLRYGVRFYRLTQESR